MNRLIIGVADKARQCAYDDAKVLAKYEGLKPGTVGYDAFVDRAMSA